MDTDAQLSVADVAHAVTLSYSPYADTTLADGSVDIDEIDPDDGDKLTVHLNYDRSDFMQSGGFIDSFKIVSLSPERTATRDPAERRRLKDMLDRAANAMSILTDMNTTLEFIESSRGDAYNVYDRRIDRANSELSKLVIGQTMTIEDGSSLSQSQTHLEVFENLCDADRDMLRDVVNNQLIPLMIRRGFPLKGMRMEWDDTVDYTPEQQVAFETMVADRYEVDGSYFADKYGMPVGGRISAAMPSGQAEESDGDKRSDSFFD